jgi:hypothetical protein
MSDLIKVTALILHTISGIEKNVKSKNSKKVTEDYNKLCRIWDDILNNKIKVPNYN